MRRTIRLLPCGLLLAAVALAPAAAADYHVRDRDGAGLAGAIRHANDSPGPDRIVLAEGGIYSLLDSAEAASALPTITDALEIAGRGAEVRRYFDQRVRLLTVAPGTRLLLRDLTLAEGGRGAVLNRGLLELERVRIIDSVADGSGVGGEAIVLNEGVLEATTSEFGYNGLSGAAADTATLVNLGRMRLVDVRVVSNRASRGHPGLAAAALLNRGELELDRVAFRDNRVIDGFGGPELVGLLNLGGGHHQGRASGGD